MIAVRHQVVAREQLDGRAGDATEIEAVGQAEEEGRHEGRGPGTAHRVPRTHFHGRQRDGAVRRHRQAPGVELG